MEKINRCEVILEVSEKKEDEWNRVWEKYYLCFYLVNINIIYF